MTDPEVPTPPAAPAARRGAANVGLRAGLGVIALAAAAAVVAAVALLPIPTSEAASPVLQVTPAPAEQLRACGGSLVRFGTAGGEDAAAAAGVGTAEVVAASTGEGALERLPLGAATLTAPETFRLPPSAEALAAAQSQSVRSEDLTGLAAASCAEPSGSVWLVGGATTVGRTTGLLVANPTAVPATVDIRLWGESGPIVSPGLAGIQLAAGEQRVFSLAGFAPGVMSPVVQVIARGGQIVATLQHSIVRGLDATGVEQVGPSPDPATELVIPGVRIADSVGTSRTLALPGWEDAAAIVRLAVPGDADATVTVLVVPQSIDRPGASFEIDVTAGTVIDVPLDAGEGLGGEETHLDDGGYTVFVDADEPVLAAVRTTTAVDAGGDLAPDRPGQAPPSDLAWFSAATPLGEGSLVAVANGPGAVLTAANPGPDEVQLELQPVNGGSPVSMVVPPDGSASAGVAAGSVYRVTGGDAVFGVSFAEPGRIAAYVAAPARPVAGALTVRLR